LNKAKARKSIQTLLNKAKSEEKKGNNQKAKDLSEDAYQISLWLQDKGEF
jgi:hypothetical protein